MFTFTGTIAFPRFIHSIALITVCFLSLAGCTSIGSTDLQPGTTDLDMGPDTELRVCLYKDVDVSDKQTSEIKDAIDKEFAQYGLNITFVRTRNWERTGFKYKEILRDIAREPLEAPCDRNLTLVSRNLFDFFWGILMPEVLGAVESSTHTKGYVVAELGSLNQVMCFQSPSEIAVHEFYHLLGVDHGDGPLLIHKKIIALKRTAMQNRRMGRDFFPGIGNNGILYLSRRAVNRELNAWLNSKHSTGQLPLKGFRPSD